MTPMGSYKRLAARLERVEVMLAAICAAAGLQPVLPPLYDGHVPSPVDGHVEPATGELAIVEPPTEPLDEE